MGNGMSVYTCAILSIQDTEPMKTHASRLVAVLLSAAPVTVPGAVFAADTSMLNSIELYQQRFKAADLNGDGALSLKEAQGNMPMVARSFDEIDANHDGLVTHSEIEAAYARRVEAAYTGKASQAITIDAIPADIGDISATPDKPDAPPKALTSHQQREQYYEELLSQEPSLKPQNDNRKYLEAAPMFDKGF
jgi:hypothetical protein